jgi:hypothetical protein
MTGHIRNSKVAGAAALVALALGACAKAPPPPRSVQFFKDHPPERQATMERCKALTTASADCENAATAGLIDAQHKPIPKPKFPTQPAQ